jgi:transmembrane sensor
MRSEEPEDLPATASEWALRLSGDELSAPERHAFAQWLAGGSDRLREVKQAQAVLRISSTLQNSEIAHAHLNESLRALRGGFSSETAAPFPTRRAFFPTRRAFFPTRRALVAGAASLAAGALFMAVFQRRRTSGPAVLANDARVATAVGAIERFNLSDRSSLTVGARSSFQIAFTNEDREISLHQGKAFFEVTHNAERPFVVKAGSHQVVATGTTFNVSYNQTKDQLEVAVVEGTVNVGTMHGASTAANERVPAGAVTLFPASRPGISRKLTPSQAAAWRTGDLYFDDAELDDILLDVNGYLPKPLVLADGDLSHLTLAAQLPAGDARATLFVLREVLGIDSRELPDHWELFKAVD